MGSEVVWVLFDDVVEEEDGGGCGGGDGCRPWAGGQEGEAVWQVNATVKANDGDYWISDDIAEYKVKGAAQLTMVIAPEKVARNAKVTVTGKLSRANWEDRKYHGFPGQQVKLQFRKKGAAHYSTVKTVTTGNIGQLTTKVTVTSAGSWRWYFPGTTTTSLKASAGDTLNLKEPTVWVPITASAQFKRHVDTRSGCRRVDHVYGCRGGRGSPVR
ncbi:hypothetical protein ACQ86D_51040 [Streptomyces galilaeus]